MEPIKAASPQGTQSAQASRTKSPAQSASDVSNPAAPGGFLALLAALDGSTEGAALSSAVSDEQILPSGGETDTTSSMAEASAMITWQGLLAPIQSHAISPVAGSQGAPMNLQSGGLGLGASLSDAQAVMHAGAQVGIGAVGTSLNEMLLAGMPQGLVAETNKLDASADLNAGTTQGVAPGFGRTVSRMQSPNTQRAGGAMGAVDMSAAPVSAREVTLPIGTIPGAFAALTSGSGERTQIGMAGERAGAVQSLSLGAEGGAPLADGLLAGGGASRGSESFAGGQAYGHGAGTAGAWSETISGASPLEAGNLNDATVFVDPSQVGAEEQVAEQVAYWVNQKTQNAELTLLRDGHPVEVSVVLSGNEAHVSFRSDQQQTRELLDQSMAQLSDLLRGEGLVLSGMSVGTSARDAAGRGGDRSDSGQSRPRDGVRQAQVVSAAPAGTASLVRGGGATDHSVDVFV